MPYEGLPDLAKPTNAGTGVVCAPYATGSVYGVMPDSVALGSLSDGGPDLSLEIHRPFVPGGSDGFAAVAVGLVAHFDYSAALVVARQSDAAATVVPVTWSAGLVRVDILGGLDGVLSPVVPFVPSGPGGGRLVIPLSLDAAEKLAGALTGAMAGSAVSVPLGGRAVIGIRGVSPRVPVVARFDPRDLLSELQALGNGGMVKRHDVENRLMAAGAPAGGGPALPIKLDVGLTSDLVDGYVAAMSDRLQAQFASLARGSDDLASGVWWQMADLASVGHGEATWDLSVPTLVERPVVVDLDATAIAAMLAGRDPATVVHRSAAPALDFGVVELQVAGRLPRPWTGALSIGVTLEAPPDPPFRFQDVSRSIDLNPGSDTVGVSMDLGGGKRAITTTAYAVVEDEQGAQRLDGPARQQEGTWIELHGDDVPVGLVFLSATPSLLALGQVTVDVARPPWNPVSTALTAAEPAVAIVAPRSADSPPTYTVRLQAKDGSGVLDVASGILEPRQLDASSVAGFGHHQVAVSARLPDGGAEVTVDLVPESSLADAAAVTTLRLTPSNPAGSWTYFADSPFHAGYCWRLDSGTAQPGPWSPPQAPEAALIIDVPVVGSNGH